MFCPWGKRKDEISVSVRWMIRKDMDEVLEIENQSFEYPWSEEDFIRCLRQKNCFGMVAEYNEQQVVGYVIYELDKRKIHILNLTVAKDWRRQGIGNQMVKRLIDDMPKRRRERIVLEVREANLPAQLFFRALGFRATNVFRIFYQDTDEDAYLMEYRIRKDVFVSTNNG